MFPRYLCTMPSCQRITKHRRQSVANVWGTVRVENRGRDEHAPSHSDAANSVCDNTRDDELRNKERGKWKKKSPNAHNEAGDTWRLTVEARVVTAQVRTKISNR